MKDQTTTEELISLIDSGNYIAIQQVFGESHPYEGNESNLRLAIERAPELEKITDPQIRFFSR